MILTVVLRMKKNEWMKSKSGNIKNEKFHKKEETEPKQKHCTAVDVTGDGSKSIAAKNNIAKEPGMLGQRTKVNWKWSNKIGQEWTMAF